MEDYDMRTEVIETLTANSDGGLPEAMTDAELLSALDALMWAAHFPEDLVKMAADYRETLPVTGELLKVMGFEKWQTGGNCTALQKSISDQAYIIITNVEDPSIPTDEELALGFEMGLVIDGRDTRPEDNALMPKGANLQQFFQVEQELILRALNNGPEGQKKET